MVVETIAGMSKTTSTPGSVMPPVSGSAISPSSTNILPQLVKYEMRNDQLNDKNVLPLINGNLMP